MPLLDPDAKKQLKVAGRIGAVGIELGLSVAAGLLLGWWLDTKFDSEPLCMWLGFALGLAAGIRSFYRVVKKTKAEFETPEDPEDAER